VSPSEERIAPFSTKRPLGEGRLVAYFRGCAMLQSHLSTTVVTRWIMLPGPPPGPHDAYRGHMWRRFGATDARMTSRGYDGPSAARPRLTARATFAMRGRSAGGEAAPGLERRQRMRLGWGLQTFFAGLARDRPRPHAGQQGQGPQRAREMPRPAGPAPHCIVVPADCARGLLNAALHGPAAPGSPHDRWPGRDLRGKDHVGGHVRGSAHTPPDQPPATPAGRQRCGQGLPVPIGPAGALRPIAGTETGPAVLRHGRQAAFALPLWPSQPAICLTRHRPAIRRGLGCHP
jgi:hypothetical protein